MFKILIADDEKIEREAIKFIINENFANTFDICEAINGREAIEKATLFLPDIIFFDIKMPGINGLEAATKVKEILPDCRIIIVSAYHYFNYAQEALSLGADEYITKPAPSAKVIEALQKVISGIEEKRAKKKLEDEKDKKLRQITQYFEDELLVLIAYGEIEEKVIKEYFTIIDARYQMFLSAVVSIFNKNLAVNVEAEIENRILKKKMLELIRDYFHSSGYSAFIRAVGQDTYILLLLDQQLDEYESRLLGIKLFSEIRNRIFEELKINLSIGIGNICSSISEIHNAFLQARSALRYDMTPGAIVSFGDISKGDNRSIYPVNKEKKLYQSILQGDLKVSLGLLEELMDWMNVNITDMEQFKQRVYELLLVLLREIIMNTNLIEVDIDTEELRKSVFFFNNKAEIIFYATEYVTKKINEINNLKTSRANALLTLAIDFLEHNYQKDISLEDVALSIQISPFYLSKLFKKEAGENFIDYLTGVRIRKAKEFLTNPLYTIKDVSYQVGYKDPNYFTRVFKKICGITPTEYQEKNL